MRSKEVEEAIKTIQEQKENVECGINDMKCIPECYDENIYNDYVELKKKADTLLAYIEDLEEKNRIQRCQLNDAFSNGFIHKDKIREKLKELEYKTLYVDGITDKKDTTIASVSCLMGKREILKELLEEEYEK